MVNEFTPDYSTPVGETIRESMEAEGMDQMDLAVAMCSHPVTKRKVQINYCILDFLFHLPDENMKMDAHTARGLERAFNVPAQFWINRHEQHMKRMH